MLREKHEVKTLIFQNKKGVKGLIQFFLYPYNFLAANKIKRTIKEFAPDIVHIHNTHYASGPAIIRAAKQMSIPVVMSLHNFRLLCPSATLFYKGKIFKSSINETFPWTAVKNKVLDNSFAKTFLTGFTNYLHRKLGTWKMVDRYLPLAEFSKKLFLESSHNFSEDKFVVKPNFVELIPKQRESSDDYIYIGRLSLEKGIIELIKAFQLSNRKLLIIGDGPLNAEVHELIRESKNIQVLGQLNKTEIIQQLSTCKALIVPSVCYEGGVPLTIIEALACKTPVVASQLGAINDEIRHNETGWTFDPYNPASINQALEDFEKNEKVQEVVTKGFEIYKSKYTVEKVINILTEEYQKLTLK